MTFNNFNDIDSVLYALGQRIGLIPPDMPFQTRGKGLVWSNNPVCNFLGDVVEGLKRIGAMEEDGEGRLRWVPGFDVHELASRPNTDGPGPVSEAVQPCVPDPQASGEAQLHAGEAKVLSLKDIVNPLSCVCGLSGGTIPYDGVLRHP